MRISELGEFPLIDQLFGAERSLAEAVGIVGIGDDCAVIPRKGGESPWLITTDLLAEGVHFRRDFASAADVGYKSLAVNLSDIAAMGGKPLYAFLSLALSPELDQHWVSEFAQSFLALAHTNNVLLLGGDTTRAPGAQNHESIVINVVIVGEMESPSLAPRLRSNARPGDVIAITGSLGESAAGLRLFFEKAAETNEDERQLKNVHLRPRAQLEEGRWLAQQSGVHALMDVSDGLVSDAPHIAEASKLSLHIETEKIPRSPAFERVTAKRQWAELDLILSGGEDYCLMCTIDPQNFESIARNFESRFGRPLSAIGSCASGPAKARFFSLGLELPSVPRGFRHF